MKYVFGESDCSTNFVSASPGSYRLLFGSVHLSMPRHDYVKSGRLAVTDKTKPIYIIYTSKTIYLIRLYSLKINRKKLCEIHRVLKNKKNVNI